MPPPNYVITSVDTVSSKGSIDAEYTDDINDKYQRISLIIKDHACGTNGLGTNKKKNKHKKKSKNSKKKKIQKSITNNAVCSASPITEILTKDFEQNQHVVPASSISKPTLDIEISTDGFPLTKNIASDKETTIHITQERFDSTKDTNIDILYDMNPECAEEISKVVNENIQLQQCSSESDAEDGFDDIYPRSLPNCPRSYIKNGCSKFDESYEKYYGHSSSQSTFDPSILQHGIDLNDDYVDNVNSEDRPWNDFYTQQSTIEELETLCSKEPMKYKKCTIQLEGPHFAICTPLDSSDSIKEILIHGRSKCGQSFSEDTVVVYINNNENENRQKDAKNEKEIQIYGEVKGIVERNKFRDINHPVFVCVIDEFEGHLMKPLCKTVPKIHIKNSRIRQKYPNVGKNKVEVYNFDEESGKLVFKQIRDINPSDRKKYIFLVVFIRWATKSVYPLGAVMKVLLSDEDINTGLEIIGLQNQVPSLYKLNTVDRVKELVDDMPAGGELPLSFLSGRKDLSDTLNVFTIDPPNSQCLDDGLSVERLSQNVFRVGVHIADVASIVPKGSDIDNEARERVVTFFPGQDFRPFHMLPEPLSEDLCSLLPGKKRLTFSIFFKIDTDGRLIEKPEIQKTISLSIRKLSYKEAWDIIVNKEKPIGKLHRDIKDLYYLALRIRKIRLGNAMHALPVEVNDLLDANSVLDTLEAHWLVEEFMILANKYVGYFVRENCKDSTILRCQDAPQTEKIKSWVESHPHIAHIIFHLQNKKISEEKKIAIQNAPNARYSNYIPLQKWVWSCIEDAMDCKREVAAWNLLCTDQLHPEQALAYEEWINLQDSAEYRCSGLLEEQGKSDEHFSLHVRNYAHFTSPIRRYSDLVIHRQLHAILENKEPAYSKKEVHQICSQINKVSKNAKRYQKQCTVLHLAHILYKNPRYFHAVVQDVSDNEVILFFPGMRMLPKQNRTIQFSLLDVCSKPKLEDDIDLVRPGELGKRKRVVVKWQKRLYKHSGYSNNTREENAKCFNLDPHQKTTFMRYKDWVSLVKTVPEYSKAELQEVFLNIRDDVNSGVFRDYVNSCRIGVNDVSSEVKKGLITKHRCEFQLPLHINQVVAVQMSAEPKLGLLVPSPQIFSISDNFKCCLSHVDDPVNTLVKYATVPTRLRYGKLQDYTKIWLPIIEMESATNAIRNEDSVTIANLPVEFRGRQGKITNKESYFNKRDIEFDAMSMEFLKPKADDDESDHNDRDEEGPNKKTNDKDTFISMASSDYLCLRAHIPSRVQDRIGKKISEHPDKKLLWVGHGKFTKVKRKNGNIDVIFSLHDKSPNPPTCEMASTDNVSLEIIQKSKVDKRTETYMKMLDLASPLAKSIALGHKVPKLGQQHLQIAATVDRGVPFFKHTNMEQRKAIDLALKSRFSLIQGPPGTGKTYTGIKLIYIFNTFNTQLRELTQGDRKQVVFCGPSNKSVDLVARWMKQKLGAFAPRMVRMYGKSYENLDFPVPGRALVSSRTMRRSKVDEQLVEDNLVLHRLIREVDKPYADELRMYDTKFRGPPEEITLKDLKEYSKILYEAKEAELKNHDVIFCTTSVAANPKFLKAVKGRIYQCIIDECGMCTEPESMVPIIGTQAEQVVLIGDHKQLRPVVLCRTAAELGLERSLFERYAVQEKHLTMLTKQYRMNPYICEFPSTAFYEGKLTTVDSYIWQELNPLKLWPRDFQKMDDPVYGHIPHLFFHIEGDEETLTVTTEEGNEKSKSNMKEVEYVVKMFKYLIDVEKVNPDTINVISQYNAQCHAMKKALLDEGLINIKINTVVASQGGEWNYVIFSTVRSLPVFLIESNPTEGWCKKNLGFITDHHQINVALTRARKGLIIIGNQNLLRCDQVWRKLIQQYSNYGCLKNAKDFPPSVQKRPQKAPRFQQKNRAKRN